MFRIVIISLLALLSLGACSHNEKKQQVTPWGETLDVENGESADTSSHSRVFSLKDIIDAGELIMLTVNGPETYYDYHGHGMGLHFLMCEKFAQKIGVSLRVEVCSDSTEMMARLSRNEGDIVAFPVSKNELEKTGVRDSFISCGTTDSISVAWAVNAGNKGLAEEIDSWYSSKLVAQVKDEMKTMLTTGFVKRHVYPFMLNKKDAVISRFDPMFRKHAPRAQCDWTLIAAQCYQESCFDPKAHSWAGACGLMQIMPSTADHLGLPRADIYSPEPNIAAACKYMAELQGKFSDVANRQERLCFALASYNGGYHHIRDAMELAKKYGKNPYRWSSVREFVLGLQSPQYYKDPVVRNGYMRGSETADYVDKIMDRWNQYRHATRGKYSSGINATPMPAKRSNKWDK